jgi:hypothetical protein
MIMVELVAVLVGSAAGVTSLAWLSVRLSRSRMTVRSTCTFPGNAMDAYEGTKPDNKTVEGYYGDSDYEVRY